jgi:hypothetical protein
VSEASTPESESVEREKCAAKRRYATKREAHRRKRVLRRTHGQQRVYHCPWCSCWHLTSAKPREASRA